MKKIILITLSLLVVSLLIVGCEDLSEEEKEILAKDGALVGQASYDKARLMECRSDQSCWSALLSCYRAECRNAPDRGACINNCLSQAEGEECVPKECVWQDYAGGIKDCGIIDDGCGGEINCNYQAYAGGLECPQGYECINQDYAGGIKHQCVEVEECVPKECVWQDYAGGVKDCGIIDDGCGGTINCNYQAYAGGLECPQGYECVNQDYAGGIKHQCIEVEECVPKSECIWQDYAGGVKECGIIDDGCGGTINCNYQAYAGGLECQQGFNCVHNQCVAEGPQLECPATDDCDLIVTLLAGEEVTFSGYEIDYLWQDYAGGIKEVRVNGESVFNPTETSSGVFNLADGATLTVMDTLNQDYAGGVHSATLCLNS